VRSASREKRPSNSERHRAALHRDQACMRPGCGARSSPRASRSLAVAGGNGTGWGAARGRGRRRAPDGYLLTIGWVGGTREERVRNLGRRRVGQNTPASESGSQVGCLCGTTCSRWWWRHGGRARKSLVPGARCDFARPAHSSEWRARLRRAVGCDWSASGSSSEIRCDDGERLMSKAFAVAACCGRL